MSFETGSYYSPSLFSYFTRMRHRAAKNQHHYLCAAAPTRSGIHDDLRRVEIIVPHLIGVLLKVVVAYDAILRISGCHIHRGTGLARLCAIEDAFRAAVCKTCRFPTLTLPPAK